MDRFRLCKLVIRIRYLRLSLLPFLANCPFHGPLSRRTCELFASQRDRFTRLYFSDSIDCHDQCLVCVMQAFCILVVRFEALRAGLRERYSINEYLGFSQRRVRFSKGDAPRPHSKAHRLVASFNRACQHPNGDLNHSLCHRHVARTVEDNMKFGSGVGYKTLMFFCPSMAHKGPLCKRKRVSQGCLLEGCGFYKRNSRFVNSSCDFQSFANI